MNPTELLGLLSVIGKLGTAITQLEARVRELENPTEEADA